MLLIIPRNHKSPFCLRTWNQRHPIASCCSLSTPRDVQSQQLSTMSAWKESSSTGVRLIAGSLGHGRLIDFYLPVPRISEQCGNWTVTLSPGTGSDRCCFVRLRLLRSAGPVPTQPRQVSDNSPRHLMNFSHAISPCSSTQTQTRGFIVSNRAEDRHETVQVLGNDQLNKWTGDNDYAGGLPGGVPFSRIANWIERVGELDSEHLSSSANNGSRWGRSRCHPQSMSHFSALPSPADDPPDYNNTERSRGEESQSEQCFSTLSAGSSDEIEPDTGEQHLKQWNGLGRLLLFLCGWMVSVKSRCDGHECMENGSVLRI